MFGSVRRVSRRKFYVVAMEGESGFGGLVVSMLASGTREFAGSNPAEAVGFFGCQK